MAGTTLNIGKRCYRMKEGLITTAQRTSEWETEAVGLGKLGASPFGSRMPKEIPGDFISAEANWIRMRIYFSCFALGLFELICPLCCVCVCIMGVRNLTWLGRAYISTLMVIIFDSLKIASSTIMFKGSLAIILYLGNQFF
jgi:hypothetical protein